MAKPLQTDKDFFRYSITGEIFAVERTWDGDIVASAGPLDPNPDNLSDLDSYDYTPDRNDWLRDNSDKLVLM